MIQNDQKIWLNEFKEFLDTESVKAPVALGDVLVSRVHADLNPNPWMVFSKVAFLQLVVGFVTLLFCPQFGIGLTSFSGIMQTLMQYGEAVCMFGCGAIFLGSSLLVSALTFSQEELRTLKANRALKVGILSLLTVGAFFCLGAEVFETLTLAWIVGSIVGGITTLELGLKTRQWIRAKVIYG